MLYIMCIGAKNYKIDILHPVLHAYNYFASYTCIMYYLIHVYIAGGFEYVYGMGPLSVSKQ